MGTAASSILSASPSLLRLSLSTHHGLLRPPPYAGLRLPHRRLTGLLRLRRPWIDGRVRTVWHGHAFWRVRNDGRLRTHAILRRLRRIRRIRHGHVRTLLLD